MKNLGETLKQAREAKGVSIKDASEETKIRELYIIAMENGTFDYDLPEIYKRGFLRLYATYLELDENAALASYLATMGNYPRQKNQHLGKIIANAKLDASVNTPEDRYPEDSVKSPNYNQGLSSNAKAIAIFVAVIIAIIALVYVVSSSSTSSSAQVYVAPEKALNVKITALKNASFTLTEESPAKTVLFDGILLLGETKTFGSDVPLIFMPENMAIENFEIERNGVKINTQNLNKSQQYRLTIPRN